MFRWFTLWFVKRHQKAFVDLMFRSRGDFFYVDVYGLLWKLTKTGDPHLPFIMSLKRK